MRRSQRFNPIIQSSLFSHFCERPIGRKSSDIEFKRNEEPARFIRYAALASIIPNSIL
jgi:hypothetical protein